MRLSLPNLKASYCTHLGLQGETLLSDKIVSKIKKRTLTLSYRYSRGQSLHELSIYVDRLTKKGKNRLLIECHPVSSRVKRQKVTLKHIQRLMKDLQEAHKQPIDFTAFVGFQYPKSKIKTPLPIKIGSLEQTELELCGIRFRGSGPLQSLIIDTFPKKMVHVNAIIGISGKLSLQLVNDVFERSKKAISRFLEVQS